MGDGRGVGDEARGRDRTGGGGEIGRVEVER